MSYCLKGCCVEEWQEFFPLLEEKMFKNKYEPSRNFFRYSRTVNSFATQVACNRGIWKLLRRTHATHLKPPLPETCVACKFPSCDANSRNLSMQKKLPPFCCCHIKMGYIFFFMYPLLMKLDPMLSKYKTNSYHKVLEPLHMIVVIRRGGKSI